MTAGFLNWLTIQTPRIDFPGVDVAGGICYFLWERDYEGDCDFTNYFNGKESKITKPLNEHDVFIRYPMSDNIIRKVLKDKGATMEQMISSRKPFGLATNVKPTIKGDLTLRYNGGTGPFKREDVVSG